MKLLNLITLVRVKYLKKCFLKIQLLCGSALISENTIRFFKKNGSAIIHGIYVPSQIQTENQTLLDWVKHPQI